MENLLSQARVLLQGSATVTVFSGAGLSAESGLSTFRDKQVDALWLRFDPAELASVQGFEKDPGRVIEWYNWRRKIHADAQPNAGHRALAQRNSFLHVTQNVDNLLEKAGVPAGNIHHLHGTITRDRCHNLSCCHEEAVELANPAPMRQCPVCGQLMRPAVVWFGEPLPESTWIESRELCRQTDCLLVVGTSATVYPAAGLIHLARQHGSKIIVVNSETTGTGELADIELIGSAGNILPRLLDNTASFPQ